MSENHADGKARIEDGQITITVAIANLQMIQNSAWAAGYTEPIRISDPAAFAKEMCHALNDESEDGTTPIHRLMDEAMIAAFESGSGDGMTEDEAEEMAASFMAEGGAA